MSPSNAKQHRSKTKWYAHTVARVYCAVGAVFADRVCHHHHAVRHARHQRIPAERHRAADAARGGWLAVPTGGEPAQNRREYNKKLAAGGQAAIGEVKDPFAGNAGQSTTSGAMIRWPPKIKNITSLLDAGQGVMAPSAFLNRRQPAIYHGTSEDALAVGAGHLYGTSLPVGGKSTHSVITGHRGLPNSLLFTRLDEMKKGDAFYIEVMGKKLATRSTALP